MRIFTRALALVALVVTGIAVAPAASAHDPELSGDGAASTAANPGQGSPNLRLFGNSPGRGVTSSDIAFAGKLAYAGDFQGFRIIDISSPRKPRVVSEFDCPGSQGDVSVYRGLLFRSVDAPRSGPTCDSVAATASTPGVWEGIQVFDVSDPRNPEVVEFIQTDCGSHTHTVLPNGKGVFIYVSSYPLTPVNIGEESNCLDVQSGGGHGYVSVIEIPDVSNPSNFEVHRAFLDEENTEQVTYDLDEALGEPPGTLGTHTFRGCHDISVFAELELAAAACFRDAQLWDISNPIEPELIWTFRNDAIIPNDLDLWHSSAFSWDGKVVAFGDESGGGVFNRCTNPDDNQGRVWFLDIQSGEVVREDFLANYKVPRAIPGDEPCTMHNFNFVPQTKGRMTLVSSSYVAGTTVVDVNALIDGASEEDAELGFLAPEGAITWSSYWYNGRIYANDEVRGLDIMDIAGIAGAKKLPIMNPQTQINVIR